jgi:nicotinate-nucleotide pyrophosphorylase (carboxylating)
MIKDNHFVEFGDHIQKRLSHLVEEARNVKHVKFVAVEVDHVDDQLNHVLEVPGIDIVLLDNMGQWQLQHAVKMRNQICGNNKKPLLEASGGITLDNIGVVASTGIDRIAVGAITHSATAVDIALDR